MPPKRPIYPIRLLVNGRPPVYTPSLKVKLKRPQLTGSGDVAPLPHEVSPEMEISSAIQIGGRVVAGYKDNLWDGEDGLGKASYQQEKVSLDQYEVNQLLPFERDWDSEGEEELSRVDVDILFQVTSMAMEQDEDVSDSNTESDGDSDVNTESEQDSDNDNEDYNPNKTIRSCRYARTSKSSKQVNAKITAKQAAKGNSIQKINPKKSISYEFCPHAHWLPILRLLSKHFCLHPLLPEQHGQTRSSDEIYRDSVREMYLQCKNSHLQEVWAYMWVNWYSPRKWRLWARSSYAQAISCRRTTMVVEAMWRNYKRLVLYLHNRPRVDFATYALVTQTLPAYRNKLLRIISNPREGRAPTLCGEQGAIRKAWLTLLDSKLNGQYDTNIEKWTCSCGTQKYHSYMLCKDLMHALPRPSPDWWATVLRRPTIPFYDIRNLLSPEVCTRVPEPEQLGDRVWLERMLGRECNSNIPSVPSLLVCIDLFNVSILIWSM